MKLLFKILKNVLVAALVLGALGLIALFFAQDFITYPGRGLMRGNTPEWQSRIDSLAVRGFNMVEIPAADGGKVKGLWSEGQGVAPALMWFHARDQNITDINQFLTPMRDLGYNLFVMEYRGYGNAEGSTREAAILSDAEVAFEYLCTKEGVASRRVYAAGVELGANLALHLAARKPVVAVVAVSPVPSMAAAVAEKIPAVPVGFLLHDRWDLAPVLPQVACPVLIIQGTEDKVISMHQAEAMGEKMTGARVTFKWMNDFGHRDVLERGGKGVWEEIDNFLVRAGR
jgi:hypothetical protein